jgi:hypothetical protein
MAFCCRICSHINFKDVVVPRGEGYYRTAFFECCGCSVVFRDPAKFSTDRDEKAKRELPEKNQIQNKATASYTTIERPLYRPDMFAQASQQEDDSTVGCVARMT